MNSKCGLSEEAVKHLLQILTDKSDSVNRGGYIGGAIANAIDDCRRLLAEAARSEGMPNLDRFYGREPPEPKAEGADSIFDEWEGMEKKSRPFPRVAQHTCGQPTFGYPRGKSFNCPACIAEKLDKAT